LEPPFFFAERFSDSTSIGASDLARFSPRITAHRFSLEIGLCSSIQTRSPIANSFF